MVKEGSLRKIALWLTVLPTCDGPLPTTIQRFKTESLKLIFNLSPNLESNWNLKITKYMAKRNLFVFFSLWVLFCISTLIFGVLEIPIHQDICWPYTRDSLKFVSWLWILKVTLPKVGEKKIFFWPLHLACGILVPRPGIKPVSTAWSLNHWTPRKCQESLYL